MPSNRTSPPLRLTAHGVCSPVDLPIPAHWADLAPGVHTVEPRLDALAGVGGLSGLRGVGARCGSFPPDWQVPDIRDEAVTSSERWSATVFWPCVGAALALLLLTGWPFVWIGLLAEALQ